VNPVGSQKAIIDTLAQTVGINGIAKIAVGIAIILSGVAVIPIWKAGSKYSSISRQLLSSRALPR